LVSRKTIPIEPKMWHTETQELRVCCRFVRKKLKPCWQWTLPQFSALPLTDSSGYRAPVVTTAGDNHERFLAEFNLHAYSFLDCILHLTFHIIYCIYVHSSSLSEISYICQYGNPASLSGGRWTKPQLADQTSYPSRFFVILLCDNRNWFLRNVFQFIIQKSPHNSTPYYLNY
jgi:hypothetical protein